MKHLVVVSYGYPSAVKNNEYVFLKKLLVGIAGYGIKISVIHPVPIKIKKKILKAGRNVNSEYENIKVYEPEYNNYPFLFPLRRLNTQLIDKAFFNAAERVFIELRAEKEDMVLYSHFLNAGMCVSELSKKYGVPAYCAVGESTLWSVKYRSDLYVKQRLSNISEFISVSSQNKNRLIDRGYASSDNIIVLPNGVDHDFFCPHDSVEMRKKLGIAKDEVIGIFVGAFIDRKGAQRVSAAVKNIDGVRMIYIGKGDKGPNDANAVYTGEVLHSDIPKYLSAADFFVLPTLAEGCCNAIVEAMACGLPVISSDGEFNDDILKDAYAIRIDPMDIKAIENAIIYMRDNTEKRKSMASEALSASEMFDVRKRAYTIAKRIGVLDEE